jgi:DNA-nicking Smr family endonuclease
MPNRPGARASRPSDAALWQDAVRDVAPLQRRGGLASAPEQAAAIPRTDVVPVESSSPRPAEPAVPDCFAGIDRATAERLKRGLRTIEARLDLHGMTQRQAHRALAEFLRASDEAGRRCVLVVTGRGLGTEGPGILKSSVPRWLAEGELRRRILAVASAQPRHGGAGALYVLLRRRR